MICGVAGRQDQRNERNELRQPDQAEIERIAGDVVHLPAHRDDLDLRGKRGEKARGDEAQDVGMAQYALRLRAQTGHEMLERSP
jgi:hypothetical protein